MQDEIYLLMVKLDNEMQVKGVFFTKTKATDVAQSQDFTMYDEVFVYKVPTGKPFVLQHNYTVYEASNYEL